MKDTRYMNAQEFWDKKELKTNISKTIFLVSFIVFCIFVVIFLFIMYRRAHSLTYLKFKINPEFILVVDGNEDVVKYLAVNEDAYNLYKSDMFEGKKYSDALTYAIDYAKEKDIIKVDESRTIDISVIGKKEKNNKKYENSVINIIKNKDSNLITNVVEVSQEEKDIYINLDLNDVKEAPTLCCFLPQKNEEDESCYVKPIMNDLSGKDRFETAVNVSKLMYPNGSKVAVVINSNDLIEGYISVNLAHVLNAPILLTPSDKLNDKTLEEIKRLEVSKIYVLGGTATISDKVINSIKNNVNVEIERISGADRYQTSINIAKKVDSIQPINSVLIASGEELVDVTFASNISAKTNMPILYSSVSKLNKDVKTYIESNKNIKNIYFVGGSFDRSVVKELEDLGREVEVVSGENRFLTNAALVKKFNSSFNSIVGISNNVDIVVASNYAVMNEAAVLYFDNGDSWTSSIDEQFNAFVKRNVIKNIYLFGGEIYEKTFIRNINNIIINSNINLSDCDKDNLDELIFTNKNAVFYIPHQDDESTYFGQLITAAIDKLGEDNVHLVLFTDGASSVVNKNGSVADLLKQNNLTFSEARDKEFLAAIKELGVKKYTFVEDLDFVDKRFSDQELKNNVNKVKEVMKYFDKLYNNDVVHFTYSYTDKHSDHNTLGSVLRDLHFDKNISLKEFENVFLIGRVDDNTFNDKVNDTYVGKFTDNKNYSKLLNAFSKYQEDLDNGMIGIGYKSAGSVFNTFEDLISSDQLFTPFHTPKNSK